MKPTDPEQLPSEPESEEVSHYDDAFITRMFRWSAIALVVLVTGAFILYWTITRKPAPVAIQVTPLVAPEIKAEAPANIPIVLFKDISTLSGIEFTHNNGATGDKLLPETMGGAVAFLDFDNDGAQDLFFVNAQSWPSALKPKLTTPALYRNDGKGHFSDVTAGSGLDVSLYGMGVAVGDFDNDGLTDIFLSCVGTSRLYHNKSGGKFEDVTARAGVGGSPQDWGTACSFFDYDNDGNLDLYVGQYVQWSRDIDFEVGYKLVGIGRAYGQPMNFGGTFPYLYHNNGNGTFSNVSAVSGLQIKNPSTGLPTAKTLGVAPVDLDADGWIDLVVANDTVQNLVFHNQRNGTFKEIGASSGIAFDSYGATRGAMGIDTGHFRNDDTIGVVIGNFANEMTALYVSQANALNGQSNALQFADEAITEGIGPASRLLLKFGVFFFDYDLDGHLDMLSSNGHLEQEINKLQSSQQYAQPAQLFWNRGPSPSGHFAVPTSNQTGSDLFRPIVGRGSAFADIDGDGDLDAIIVQTGSKPLLLRNDNQLGHHWVRLKLEGRSSNRSAIGARVTLRILDQTQHRQVMPTRSYLSQSELPITFGLGTNTTSHEIKIVWPGGRIQKLDSVPLDRITTVKEPL